MGKCGDPPGAVMALTLEGSLMLSERSHSFVSS